MAMTRFASIIIVIIHFDIVF